MHRFNKWRAVIQIAPTTKAVVDVMRDYVNSLPPEVVAVLPDETRSAINSGPLDVQRMAVTLLHAELTHQGQPEVGQILHEVAHTFAAAATRLTLVQEQRTSSNV